MSLPSPFRFLFIFFFFFVNKLLATIVEYGPNGSTTFRHDLSVTLDFAECPATRPPRDCVLPPIFYLRNTNARTTNPSALDNSRPRCLPYSGRSTFNRITGSVPAISWAARPSHESSSVPRDIITLRNRIAPRGVRSSRIRAARARERDVRIATT